MFCQWLWIQGNCFLFSELLLNLSCFLQKDQHRIWRDANPPSTYSKPLDQGATPVLKLLCTLVYIIETACSVIFFQDVIYCKYMLRKNVCPVFVLISTNKKNTRYAGTRWTRIVIIQLCKEKKEKLSTRKSKFTHTRV